MDLLAGLWNGSIGSSKRNEQTISTLDDEETKRAVRALLNRSELTGKGKTLVATDGHRSFGEQEKLYATGRAPNDKRAKLTNARGGESWHNYGVAVDIDIVSDGQIEWNATSADYEWIAGHGAQLGFTWGGNFQSFVDRPHFQRPAGRTMGGPVNPGVHTQTGRNP